MTAEGLSVEEALAKTTQIPQFFGLTPYNRGPDYRLSVWRAAYSILISIVMVISSVYLVFVDRKIAEERIVLFQLLATCATSIVVVMTPMLDMEEKNQAFQALKASGVEVVPRKMSTSPAYYLLVIGLFVADMLIYDPRKCLYLYWPFYISMLIHIACLCQFSEVTGLVADAFSEIRVWLTATRPRIEPAIKSFERLTVCAQHLNNIFGLQLLMMVGTHFVLATTHTFLIVTEGNLLKRLSFVLWCMASAAFPLRIVHAVHNLAHQREEFNNCLNGLISRGFAFSTQSQTNKVKLHISMKRELEFTALGFFTLDYGLINSMLGAVTTYLVILMQFSSGPAT